MSIKTTREGENPASSPMDAVGPDLQQPALTPEDSESEVDRLTRLLGDLAGNVPEGQGGAKEILQDAQNRIKQRLKQIKGVAE